jgi:hypothetical protein
LIDNIDVDNKKSEALVAETVGAVIQSVADAVVGSKDAAQVSVDKVSKTKQPSQVALDYTVSAKDASAKDLEEALESAETADAITDALNEAGFEDASAEESQTTDLSPTASPVESPVASPVESPTYTPAPSISPKPSVSPKPTKATKKPTYEPTYVPTSNLADVGVHQGISGVNPATYASRTLEFNVAVKSAVAEILQDEADTQINDVEGLGDDNVPTDDAVDDDYYVRRDRRRLSSDIKVTTLESRFISDKKAVKNGINGASCSLATTYEVRMSRKSSTELQETLTHPNATAVITRYLQWYGFLDAQACVNDVYAIDLSPTYSPTTMQPSSRPSARPTSKPTTYVNHMLSALQQINGLSLEDGNSGDFKKFFAEYTAKTAGVPIENVNVSKVFPASDYFSSTRGGVKGATGDLTIVQYTVQSNTLSEEELTMNLNNAVLTNTTTAALEDAGYGGTQSLYRIQVIMLTPTATPTPAPTEIGAHQFTTAEQAGIAVGAVVFLVGGAMFTYYLYVQCCLVTKITGR